MTLFDKIEFQPAEKHEPSEYDKPSRAVVAMGEHDGVVLWHIGAHIHDEIQNVGSKLSDLGLDDAPQGISVWEGVWVGHETHTFDGTEYESHPSGKFREPTDEEWAAIRKGDCPWETIEWLQALR